jgi:Flp pilus assembly protein TadD
MLGPAKHSPDGHELLGIIGLAKKRFPDAISEFVTMTSAEPEEPEEWALLTYAYAQAGDRREALEAFAKLNQLSGRRYVAPYWMAVAWTGFGDHDKAIFFLNEAYRIRSSTLPNIQSNALFDPLRSDPRFEKLLHEIALPTLQ